MDRHDGNGTQERFRSYSADVVSVLGHADRVRPFEDYCIGLLSAEGRKSVEPLAAMTAPERTAAQHQSLLHLVAQAPWSDAAILRRMRERVLPSITRTEPLQAWIIDDTGFPKKGSQSVGVTRQYCGSRASGTTARWQSACRWRPTRAACPWPGGCICHKTGPMTRSAGARPACPRTSASRPSPKSPCSRCVRLWPMACRQPWR